MNILLNHKGYLLIERYGRIYIQFYGGYDDLPCEIPVSDEDSYRVMMEPPLIDDIIKGAKKDLTWTADSFREIGIREYLIYHIRLSQTQVDKTIETLLRHKDICNEFYRYIIDEEFPASQLSVEGYTAEQICKTTCLTPLGAYCYLIYLRENPEKALADLAAGLPRK